MNMPRALRSLPMVAAVSFLAVSCTASERTDAGGTGDVGGTMVISVPTDAGTLLPPLITSNLDREAADLLYDRLAEIGPDMNTVGDKGFTPALAERWEWAPDSQSIAFHINPRARWHDGQPVRASDVRYSFGLVKDPATGSSATPLIGNIDSVSVRDSLTAVAHFRKHTPDEFYDLVYQVLIVPEHLLSGTSAAQLKTAEVARKGIGSGRFRLARWEPGQRIELVADTLNYRGRPKLDRVVFSIAPDFNTALTRFFAGDADMFEVLKAEHLARFKDDTMRRVVRYPTTQYAYFGMNMVDPAKPTQPHPLFRELAVRRALSMAVDRRAMLRNVFDTLGQALYGPFPHAVSVADTTLPQIGFDVAKAGALLDSAGWTAGSDGVRVKNGRRLEFGVVVPNSSAARKQYAVLLQDAFKKIGAAMRIEEVDFPTFVARQTARTFDAEMVAYGTDPGVSGFKQSWGTAGITKGGANFLSYSNPRVDALLDSATSAFDPLRTKSYARQAFQTIMDDAPAIWLYEPLMMAGLDRRIQPTTMRADGYWSDLANWYIPANKRNARDRIGLRQVAAQ